MKRTILMTSLLALVLGGLGWQVWKLNHHARYAEAVKVDRSAGFRDLTFGQKLQDIKGMVPYVSKDERNTYLRPSDLLMMNNGDPLAGIVYYFNDNDELYKVIVYLADGYSVDEVTVRELSVRYGKAKKDDTGYGWTWHPDGVYVAAASHLIYIQSMKVEMAYSHAGV